MVPVQDNRLPSTEGKAEIPGAGEVMSCMSSVCNLEWLISKGYFSSSEHEVSCHVPLGDTTGGVLSFASIELGGGRTAKGRILIIFSRIIHSEN